MRFAGMAVAYPAEQLELTPPARRFAFEEEPAVAALIPGQTLTPRQTTIWTRIRQFAAGLLGWIFLPNGRA